VVCYPVLALRPWERNIPAYMRNLEEVGIKTLRSFGIEANRLRDSSAHIGLWCRGRKVVSMGIRVTGWVTSFGFAVNLEGDHGPCTYIRPCGLKGVRLTTFEEVLGKAPPRAWVLEALKGHFEMVFGRTAENSPAGFVEEIWSRVPATDTLTTRSGWRT
jgi:lipoate-protein ligase B